MTTDVRADLRAKIAAGYYKPGDRLPRVNELMTTYDLRSRATLDRALRDLVAEGLLTRVHGSGIFVRERQTVKRDLVAGLKMEHERATTGEDGRGLFEAMTGTLAKVMVSYVEMPAPDDVASALSLSTGDAVLQRIFRYFTDGKPHQVATSYMPISTARSADLAPEGEVPGTSTMAQLARAGILVTRVALEIGSRMPTAQETTELTIPPGTPIFEHHRTMYAGDVAAETSTAIIPADRVTYVFSIDLQ